MGYSTCVQTAGCSPAPPTSSSAQRSDRCGVLLGQVEVAGVENVNLSRLVGGHQDYLGHMEDILEALNLHC